MIVKPVYDTWRKFRTNDGHVQYISFQWAGSSYIDNTLEYWVLDAEVLRFEVAIIKKEILFL